MHLRLSEIIAKFGGSLVGEDVEVSSIAPTDLADFGQITFLSDRKYKNGLSKLRASAIIIRPHDAEGVTIPQIHTDNPYYYFSCLSNLFNPRKSLKKIIEKSAWIDPSAVIGKNPAISHNVVVGATSQFGNNIQIFAGVVIGDNVKIGDNVIIYPNVTIYSDVTIGNNCVIHAGSVIGSDGFGNAQDEKRHYHRIAQIGGVMIGNDVEIGANTTIDCGTFSPTLVKDGARIDNLVQVAHNVEIGAHTGIAAHVGIAGNSKIGNYCMLGGKSGIADHVSICDYSVIGGSSNVGKDITIPGLYSCGMTVMEYKEWAKIFVQIRNIGKINMAIKQLQEQIAALESK